MEIERARYLVSPEGRAALHELSAASAPGELVARSAWLRDRFEPAAAAALGEQLSLRERAASRFGELAPHDWLYTAEGMQMMTHPLVAGRRAARVASLGLPFVDATCGLGTDLAAVAAEGVPSTGIETSLVTAILARANLAGQAHVVQGDARAIPFDISGAAVFIDPSRREGASRRFDPAAFSPPWDVCVEIATSARSGVIKTAPGIDERHLPPGAEVEFVQVGRSLREATAWLGEGASPGLRRAVMLPAGATLTSAAEECDPMPQPVGRYLFDPEGCVTRAGLVRHYAALHGAWLLDEQVAYVSGDRPAWSPFGTTLEVLETVPFSVARLRQALKTGGWRPDEIRRRAFPVEPDELRRLLRRKIGDPVTLICTTLGGQRVIFIARKLEVDETAGQ